MNDIHPNENEVAECVAHWAPRVRQDLIRRLYETDARGIYDEELIDEVGYGLLARCESFIEANEARGGRPKCFRCGAAATWNDTPGVVNCTVCDWKVSWESWLGSIKGRQLSGAEPVLQVMREFVAGFTRTKDLREKTFAIDRLLHQFHWYVMKTTQAVTTRPVAVNLIEGRMSEVIAFLDRLTYGDAGTPGLAEQRAEWRRHIEENSLPT